VYSSTRTSIICVKKKNGPICDDDAAVRAVTTGQNIMARQ
jgi:hypothetical protein